MTRQATAVFWIGLILIYLNFWLSAQSTALWRDLTQPRTSGNSGSSQAPPVTNPGTGTGPGPVIGPLPMPLMP